MTPPKIVKVDGKLLYWNQTVAKEMDISPSRLSQIMTEHDLPRVKIGRHVYLIASTISEIEVLRTQTQPYEKTKITTKTTKKKTKTVTANTCRLVIAQKMGRPLYLLIIMKEGQVVITITATKEETDHLRTVIGTRKPKQLKEFYNLYPEGNLRGRAIYFAETVERYLNEIEIVDGI